MNLTLTEIKEDLSIALLDLQFDINQDLTINGRNEARTKLMLTSIALGSIMSLIEFEKNNTLIQGRGSLNP